MSAFEAIDRACALVGIVPPSNPPEGRWVKTDILGVRNGKGDGRVIVNDRNVTAYNWQTGEKQTVWVDDDRPIDKARVAREIRRERDDRQERAARAAGIAAELCRRARLGSTHTFPPKASGPNER